MDRSLIAPIAAKAAMRASGFRLGGRRVAAVLTVTASVVSAWDIRVGFINPGKTVEFWLQVQATMQAAASELGIGLDVGYTDREHEKTIAVTEDMLRRRPLPDYLIATNDIGEIIKRADAAGGPVILLSNDLDEKQWEEFGEPAHEVPPSARQHRTRPPGRRLRDR
jgi:ABC-type sugar transport system substrate-binding protein